MLFLQSLYFLPLIFLAIRMAVFSKCTLAPKVPKARHAESAVGSFFVHKLPMGNIPQSNEPCHSSLSYVFRVLWNSFSYPRAACITSSQTVLALFPKNIRALIVPFNGAGNFYKLPMLAFLLLIYSQRLLSKNTALSKSQATNTEKARNRVWKFS